jgi:hypothetical protein
MSSPKDGDLASFSSSTPSPVKLLKDSLMLNLTFFPSLLKIKSLITKPTIEVSKSRFRVED